MWSVETRYSRNITGRKREYDLGTCASNNPQVASHNDYILLEPSKLKWGILNPGGIVAEDLTQWAREVRNCIESVRREGKQIKKITPSLFPLGDAQLYAAINRCMALDALDTMYDGDTYVYRPMSLIPAQP